MEDFSTRTYGTSGLDNRPLFGETSAKVSAALETELGCVCFCVYPQTWLRPLKVLVGRESWFFNPTSLLRCLSCHSVRFGQVWPRSPEGGRGGKLRKFRAVGDPSGVYGSPSPAPLGRGGGAGVLTLRRLQVCN